MHGAHLPYVGVLGDHRAAAVVYCLHMVQWETALVAEHLLDFVHRLPVVGCRLDLR